MSRVILMLTMVFLMTGISVAQQLDNIPIDQATINRELQRRGLTEDEARVKLEEKGIDIDNINASQLPQLEAALEEIDKELRAEKEVAKEAQEAAGDIAEEVQEAVEDGATVQEAIAEELVEETQEKLPESLIYGQQVFRDKTLKVFSQSEDIQPSPNYVLGPGDKINVSIWGISQEDATYEINQSGYIKPTGMSRISLKGITYAKAKDLLRSRFSQFYRFRPEEFEVTITYARTINVNIYGEVFNPGGFTIPATNTAFNALIAAGGPTDIGSVRDIKLMSGNTTKQIDVYEFMMNPAIQEDFSLQNNDVIFVNVAKKIVDIQGAVRRPLKYELLPNEQLKQLIDYAAGLSPNAYTNNIQVKRFENNEEKIIDVDLASLMKTSGDFTLQNGDIVTISSVPTDVENFVAIEGAVEIPSEFELELGMRISDLVKKGVLKRTAKTDIAYLIRVRTDGTASYERVNIDDILANPSAASNLVLQPRDRLNVLSQTAYVDQEQIEIIGHLRNPRALNFDPEQTIRVADAVLLSGGLKPGATAFAYIRRFDPNADKEIEYIRINLANALSDAASGDNQVLQAKDRLIIYSKSNFLDKSTVSIRGAVKEPGEFAYDQSLTLTDVLTLAGGFTLSAAKNRIDVFRIQILDNEPTKTVVATLEANDTFQVEGSDFTLEPYDQIVVRQVPNFELQQLVTLKGEVKYPGTYALLSENEQLSSLIKRAGGLTDEAFPEGAKLARPELRGYVVMDLEAALNSPNSNDNLIMKRGDELMIPKRKDLVGINVANTKAIEIYPDRMLSAGRINVPYSAGKNAKYYVNEYAAGFGEKANKYKVVVEHPNGEIARTKRIFFFKKYPEVREGSVVTIGRKSEKQEVKEEKKSEPTDWGNVVANTVAQVTAVLTLVLLVQRLD